MSVGANIKRMREAADMAQEQLAEKLEAAQKTPFFVKLGYAKDMLHMANCTDYGT